MTTAQKHTPTPWDIGKLTNEPKILPIGITLKRVIHPLYGNGESLMNRPGAVAYFTSEEDRDYTLTACNSHAALVEALELMEYNEDGILCGWPTRTRVEAALLAAKGGK